jgi:hypothetical protein
VLFGAKNDIFTKNFNIPHFAALICKVLPEFCVQKRFKGLEATPSPLEHKKKEGPKVSLISTSSPSRPDLAHRHMAIS